MDNIKHSRRNFIKLFGAGAAAFTLPRFKSFSSFNYKPQIGLQLYTIRKNIENDFEASIKKTAEIGYKGIETYTLPENITLDNAAKVFKNNRLEIFSMHSELPAGNTRDSALKMADAYNCHRIVYHGWPQGDKYKNNNSIKHMVDVYNEAASFLKTRGLKFGLHNHWWEFKKNDDNTFPFYYLLENLDKEIFFEIDTYWAKTAGQDPAKILEDFGNRAPLLHIKDGPAIEGEESYKQVPAGKGVMDFPAIYKAGGENTKWMIVEFDEYDKDIFDGIKDSYNYLTKNGLAEGKL